MVDELFKDLESLETDIDGALYRLSGDKSTYMLLLRAFSEDNTMDELEADIREKKWDEIFTAAHALKGLAGNMGFTPLFHTLGELVIIVRGGRTDDILASYQSVKRSYDKVMVVLNNYILKGVI